MQLIWNYGEIEKRFIGVNPKVADWHSMPLETGGIVWIPTVFTWCSGACEEVWAGGTWSGYCRLRQGIDICMLPLNLISTQPWKLWSPDSELLGSNPSLTLNLLPQVCLSALQGMQVLCLTYEKQIIGRRQTSLYLIYCLPSKCTCCPRLRLT